MTQRTKWLFVIAAVAVLAAVLVGSALIRANRYDRALEHLEQGNTFEAIRLFYGVKGYKESEAYITEFEGQLMASLAASGWSCEPATTEVGGQVSKGICQFLFREDYTGTENRIAVDPDGSEAVESEEFTYKFQCNAGRIMLIIVYEAGQEAPYLLTLTEQETGFGVEKLYGAFQFFETYEMRDYLPQT